MFARNIRLGLNLSTRLNIQSITKNSYTIKNSIDMSECVFSGKKLQAILLKLIAFAPQDLAESWDNVGLLVDPIEDKPIKSILLTNDLTEEVVNEAIKLKSGLIITYHPNIFAGMKRVTSK